MLNGRELLTHAGRISATLAKETSEIQLNKLRDRLRNEEKEKSLDELEQDLNAMIKHNHTPKKKNKT